MSGYLSIQHSSSSSFTPFSSSALASTRSSSSLPSSSRNNENEDSYKFEASRILSGIYGLVVTFVGIGIINAAFNDPQEASISSKYNSDYLVFLSAIGLLFMLSTFAYDVYLYRICSTSIIDNILSNTLKAANRLFGFAAAMHMIVVTMLYNSEAYQSITWVCFYLAQLIYLDMYSGVYFRKYVIYNRFGIMHLLATNIVFWCDIVVYDTKEDYYDPNMYPSCNSSAQDDQDHKHDFRSYVGSARTYVGAFAAEYCLIAVCLLRSMWSNIGRTVIRWNTENISKRTYPIMKSFYGIIGGMLVLSLILTFGACVFVRVCRLCEYYSEVSVVVYGLVSACSLICMINTNLLEEREDDGGRKPEETTSSVIYDGVLLMFCLSLFILKTMYTTVSLIIEYKTIDVKHGYTAYVILVCLYFFFPIFQTVLIIIWQTHTVDRSRRHRLKMNLVIFLTISNFALWIGGHYELKLGHIFFITEAEFFGKYLWYIIHHITGSFLILYFFHSSVCLFEIWTFGKV